MLIESKIMINILNILRKCINYWMFSVLKCYVALSLSLLKVKCESYIYPRIKFRNIYYFVNGSNY